MFPRVGMATWTRTVVVGSSRSDSKKFGERAQANIDALGVIQTIHAEHERLWVAEFGSQVLSSLHNCWMPCQSGKTLGVDSDRECRSADLTALEQDFSLRSMQAKYLVAGINKMDRVLMCLEANKVRPEQSSKNLSPPRDLSKQTRRRKRDVQEETDFQIDPLLSENTWKKL